MLQVIKIYRSITKIITVNYTTNFTINLHKFRNCYVYSIIDFFYFSLNLPDL